MIDLHTHTDASDGELSFEELIREAKKAGLGSIAITDHDTVGSARKIRGDEGLEAIPGIELSVFDHELGYSDIHILGLFIDASYRPLASKLEELSGERTGQKIETINVLQSIGYEITFEEVRNKAKGSIGRPHIAKVLLEKYPDDFRSMRDVFKKLLGSGKKAYVERNAGFGLSEAIELVRGAGGLSFLAHPFVYSYDPDKVLADFKNLGGDGVEAYYDYETNSRFSQNRQKESIKKGIALAEEFSLLVSGGSDFHGLSKDQSLGTFEVPDDILSRMKAVLAGK